MKKLVSIAFLLLLPFGLFAEEEHPLSTIKGPGIDLKTYDHAIAGSIKDFLIWGFVDETSFTSELIIRKDGKTFKTLFKRWADGTIGGKIVHSPLNSVEKITTTVHFSKLNPDKKEIVLNINEKPVVIKVTFDDFSGGHFLNPTFSTTYNGENITFTLNGEACYGMSLHLSMMIVGAMVH